MDADQIMTDARNLRASLWGASNKARDSHGPASSRSSSAQDAGDLPSAGGGAMLDAALPRPRTHP
jgi:hypothetical protein